MPLQIAICEDSVDDAMCLQKFIQQSKFSTMCKIFASGEEFLLSFYMGQYDIIFMDIYMNGMQGIQVVSRVRELDEEVIVIFTTASTDHTLESYRLGALKYIEKPMKQKEIQETLELAFLKRQKWSSISFLIDGKSQNILLHEIFYFEQKNRVVEVKMGDYFYRLSAKIKLKDIEEQLSSTSFLRCHYSYIVNLRYVQELDKELMVFIMKNGDLVHIRRGDLKKARTAYEEYLFAIVRGKNFE